MNREHRVYRYLQQNEGWQLRDKVMHWTGFPSPKDRPVGAYAMFAATVDRLNRILAPRGERVVGGQSTGENYRLEKFERDAA